MTVAHSKHHTLLVEEETTYGTAVTPDKDLGLIQSFNATPKRNHNKVYATGSREVQEIVSGSFEQSLDGELFLQHGRPLYYLLGSVSHSLTSSDTKHTFTVGTTIPSLTIEDSFNMTTDIVSLYDGCKFGEATISCEVDQPLKMKWNGLAQSVDTSESSASASVISTLPTLSFKHLSVLTGVAGSETSPGKIQSFNLSYKNDLLRQDAAGEIETQGLTESNCEFTGDFSILFEDVTEYQRFLGTTSSTSPQTTPTPFSTVINAHNGITLGSGRREFYIQLDDCQYEEVDKGVSVGDQVVATFKFNAEGLGTNDCYFVDNIAEASF